MHTSTTGPGQGAGAAKHPPLSRWHRLLYALVAFAVVTVVLGLYLSHQYMEVYARSVAVNQAWTERLHQCARLGRLVAAVNAPGNDVFQTHQVGVEEAKMQVALRLFNDALDEFQEELGADAGADEAAALRDGLQGVRRLVGEMTADARRLFAHLARGQTQQAGARMAAMDRRYAEANQTLERLREAIAAIQKQHFEDQMAVLSSRQRFQYGVSALILLMLCGSVAYGQRVRRQVEAATQEKVRSIKALRESEARLDQRVRERTAELERANESLRTEVNERRRTEEALRMSEGRYRSLVEVRRQLLNKLLSAQEDERGRIARDLHDEIGQALTSLLIGLRTVAGAPTLAAARGQADGLRGITLAALQEVRRLARGLRPSVLDDLGLAPALERYAADYARAHGIDVQVQVADAADDRLPGEVETALYRIAQEALTNTAKHAAARHVRIVLDRPPGAVRLVVSDDGRGFRCHRPEAGGHLGLSGMQERAALLNGSVTVESDPGRGTTITVSVPWAEENHETHSRAGGGRPCGAPGGAADAH